MGIQTMENATYALVGGKPSMVISEAGTHIFVINIKPTAGDVYNYYWAGQDASEDGGTITLTWEVTPFVYNVEKTSEGTYSITDEFGTEYSIAFADASKVYNGHPQTLVIEGELPVGLRVRYEGSAINVANYALPEDAKQEYEIARREISVT